VRFYASTNFIPYGIGSDHYRTKAIVMRKIPAEGVHWMMGSPDDEDGRVAEREIRHGVVFSEDYYMGIYELTQGQIASSGYTEFYAGFTNYEDSPLCPADALHMQNLRGCDSYPTSSKKWWPQSGHTVTSGSIIGVLRAKCGLEELDLPTESQWEYACRAGTTTPYNFDTNVVKLNSFCWHKNNTARRPKPVGKLLPNAWGLYDMHGNVNEWCLDRLTLTNDYTKAFPPDYALRGVVVDPVGGELCTTVLHSNGKDWMNNQVINRGGSWFYATAQIAVFRSAYRGQGTFNTATKVTGPTSDKEGSYNGARLCLPARFN
jgi:formylglycine-generating enzyme required for sulfatase activity